MLLRQSGAIFLDAYRELNSKKLFWITLVLSGIVVAACACLGISERGLTFLHWELNFGPSTAFVSREMFYKQFLFVGFGIKFWLTWVATILALISTASIFPDFMSSGSIELVLSRPIGRLRLFVTKYLSGLLFVAFQITVFTAASFLVIGIRGGAWEPRLFLAIPLVLCFFSYIFSICVFLGLVTRSAIASLLITILIWLACWGVYAGDSAVDAVRFFHAQRITALDKRIDQRTQDLEALKTHKDGLSFTEAVANATKTATTENALTSLKSKKQDSEWWRTRLDWARRATHTVYTCLPKMAETKDLLELALLTEHDRKQIMDDDKNGPTIRSDDPEVPVDDHAMERHLKESKLNKSAWWVLGTSLGFEVLVLGLAARIFYRRDF